LLLQCAANFHGPHDLVLHTAAGFHDTHERLLLVAEAFMPLMIDRCVRQETFIGKYPASLNYGSSGAFYLKLKGLFR